MEQNSARATGTCVGAGAPVGFAAMADSCHYQGLSRLLSALVAPAGAAITHREGAASERHIYVGQRAKGTANVGDSLESPSVIGASLRSGSSYRISRHRPVWPSNADALYTLARCSR